MNKIIEHLKAKPHAQPFGLRTSEEQEVFKKATRRNCLIYIETDTWRLPSRVDSFFAKDRTYILKPDYEPEPEYVDIEVVLHNKRLRCDVPFDEWTSIEHLMSLEKFIRFFQVGLAEYSVPLEKVSILVYEGKTIKARFRT